MIAFKIDYRFHIIVTIQKTIFSKIGIQMFFKTGQIDTTLHKVRSWVGTVLGVRQSGRDDWGPFRKVLNRNYEIPDDPLRIPHIDIDSHTRV